MTLARANRTSAATAPLRTVGHRSPRPFSGEGRAARVDLPIPTRAGSGERDDEANFVVDLAAVDAVDVHLDGSPWADERGRGPAATDVTGVPADLASPRVSIVIPTYNEAKNLPHVLARIPEDVHEVIVVDGRSVDGTVEVAQLLRPDVTIVLQNRVGKGNAMACGFAAATGDIVVMLDADGSADPLEIPRFVEALTGGADFAKGTRFAAGGGSDDITAVRAWGNRWLNRITNVLFGTRYTDLCYGYNAFWRHCLDRLELDPRHQQVGGKLWGDGFEIETIINTRVAKAGLRITEVPSFEHQRVHGESNLNTWRDGSRVLRALVVERVNGAGGRGRGLRRSRPTPAVAGSAAAVARREGTGEVVSA